jgi:hypothetical protein
LEARGGVLSPKSKKRKVKGKAAQRHEGVWWNGYIDPYFLHFGSNLRRALSFMPLALYLQEKEHPVPIG